MSFVRATRPDDHIDQNSQPTDYHATSITLPALCSLTVPPYATNVPPWVSRWSPKLYVLLHEYHFMSVLSLDHSQVYHFIPCIITPWSSSPSFTNHYSQSSCFIILSSIARPRHPPGTSNSLPPLEDLLRPDSRRFRIAIAILDRYRGIGEGWEPTGGWREKAIEEVRTDWLFDGLNRVERVE